mgnify:CR=1 FL=1
MLESRLGDEGDCVRRRRECEVCGKRFTTFERVEGPLIRVVKKDGRREIFNREKMATGLRAAFHKRPVSTEIVNNLVDELEKWAINHESNELESSLIGKEILSRIKSIDRVAWLRFASVYLAFENLRDFEKMIDDELKK